MELDRRDLKRRAREAMKQTSPKFWVVSLVYILTATLIKLLPYPIDSMTRNPETGFSFPGFFCSILVSLIALVVEFGYTLWSLWTWRKMNPGLGSLFQGFSISGRVILLKLLIFIRVAGWTFLLSFGLSFLVMLIPSPPFMLLSFGIVYGIIFMIALRYSLAPYLLADRPDDGPGMAIARSVEMMRGRKMELFKLHLSFLGWHLINFVLSNGVALYALVSSGVMNTPLEPSSILLYQSVVNSLEVFLLTALLTLPLSLWLTPYTSVSLAGFYDELLKKGSAKGPEMPPL